MGSEEKGVRDIILKKLEMQGDDPYEKSTHVS